MSIRNLLKPDISIIGSGIIGNSIALSLQRKGFQVQVFDKNQSTGFGTTSYSSGICRMYYSLPVSAKFAWEGYHRFQNWRDSLGLSKKYDVAELNECGAMILKSDISKDFINHTSNIMRQIGVPVQDLDLIETHKKVSKLGMDVYNNYYPLNINDNEFGIPKTRNDLVGSIFMEKSGYISNPQLACNNIYQAAKQEGVIFNFNSNVNDIIVENEKVKGIHLDNNVFIDSPIVINASGPYSSKINDLVYQNSDMESDINIKCRPMRIEVAYTNNLKDMETTNLEEVNMKRDGLVVIDLDNGIYFRPDLDNNFLIGSTEAKCDKIIWADDLDNLDDGLTDQWTNQIYRAALRIPNLPIPSGTNKKFVVSTYDVSDDWTPIYDKSNIGGYYMAMGSSGNQFKNAGAIGPMFADLVESVENGHLHDENPVKHKLEYINEEIDLGTFSRLRQPLDTTANVFG